MSICLCVQLLYVQFSFVFTRISVVRPFLELSARRTTSSALPQGVALSSITRRTDFPNDRLDILTLPARDTIQALIPVSLLDFVCTVCRHSLKHSRYRSLYYSHSVPYLYVSKFSTPLVFRPALSAVPARHASVVVLHAKAVVHMLEAREKCAKYYPRLACMRWYWHKW